MSASDTPSVLPAGEALCIIAGRGTLPQEIAAAQEEAGHRVIVAAVGGFCDPDFAIRHTHIHVGMGELQKLWNWLRAQDCRHVVLAGGADRPRLSTLKMDRGALKLYRAAGFRALGDDGLLSAVSRGFESEGFTVHAPSALLGDLSMPSGLITGEPLSTGQMQLLWRGVQAAKMLGSLDAGQACVIDGGGIAAMESRSGTAAMLEAVAQMDPVEDRILVKALKPGQNASVDQPSIGPETIGQCVAAGVRIIANEAGTGLLLAREETIRRARAAGVTLYGF